MSSIDKLVRSYARLLRAAWDEVVEEAKQSATGSYMQDWQQANWEMFVEAALPVGTFLEVYGDGADCNGASSRVYMPSARATHVVVCVPPVGGGEVKELISATPVSIAAGGVRLQELVTISGTWYEARPPFDCVLVESGMGPMVFSLDDVIFDLKLLAGSD
jgi:hypothetical protein